MKVTKKQISNLLFAAILIVLLVTPAGRLLQVGVNRLLASSPGVTAVENREKLSNYYWELRSLDGLFFNFEEAKGKVALVNFWATWCPPCIAELPGLQKLYNEYKEQVVFVFVSGESPTAINDFLTKRGYTLPVFQSVTTVPKEFFSESIPATYIIGKKGDIVLTKKGVAHWNSKKVRALLEELIAE